MSAAANDRRWSRRRVLGTGVFLAAAAGTACGEESATPFAGLRRPYWEPALTVATRSVEVIRAIESSIRAVADDTLSLERFVTAVQSQMPEIRTLSELLIPLEPPVDARSAHERLASAVDALVEIIPTLRSYEQTGRRELLVHVATLRRTARAELAAFAEEIGPGRARSGLRDMLLALGEFELRVHRVPKLAVLVGQFEDEAAARAALGGLVDSIQISPVYRRWVEVGRFADANAADEAAALWRSRGLETRTEAVDDLSLEVDVLRPHVARSWTEAAWLQRLEFEPTALASSQDGERIVAVSRAGDMAVLDHVGGRLWERDLRMPLAGASIHPTGSIIAAHGFDLMLMDGDGVPIWPAPIRPDNQLLEQVLFDESGLRSVVRSTNASGLGHVFAFDRNGQLWGPTKEYIAASSVDMHSESRTVAVGSSRLGENQVVLIRPDGNLHQRFGVGAQILQVLFTRAGDRTLAVTAEGVRAFDSDSGDPVAGIDFPAKIAARIAGTDTLVLSGDPGTGAFGIDGNEIWFNPGLRARRLLPTRDYVVAWTGDSTATVIRSDGSLLGAVETLSPIRAIAVAADLNMAFAVTSERTLVAWRLPPPNAAVAG